MYVNNDDFCYYFCFSIYLKDFIPSFLRQFYVSQAVPQTCYVAEDNLEFLTLLCLPLEWMIDI